uniref:CSON011980 protein n=1 Tax=Culicoides sonorensis TaxID=179676 RepID=A0A336KV43_CULSO
MSVKLLILIKVFILIKTGIGQNSTEIELPPDMIICTRNSSNSIRSNCIKDSLNQIIPLLKEGFVPLDFPALDPFYVNATYIEFNQNFLKSKINVTNTFVSGSSTGKVNLVRSKMNATNLLILFDLHIPLATIDTDYEGETQFNDLIVNSNGHAIVECYDVVVTFKFNGALETIGDQEFMIIQNAKIADMTMKKMKIKATGVVPDPDLNVVVLELLNEIWEDLFKQVFPNFKSEWDPIVLELINKFFGQVPFKLLMKDE